MCGSAVAAVKVGRTYSIDAVCVYYVNHVVVDVVNTNSVNAISGKKFFCKVWGEGS